MKGEPEKKRAEKVCRKRGRKARMRKRTKEEKG